MEEPRRGRIARNFVVTNMHDEDLPDHLKPLLAAISTLSAAEACFIRDRAEQVFFAKSKDKVDVKSLRPGTWGIIVGLRGSARIYNGTDAEFVKAAQSKIVVKDDSPYGRTPHMKIPGACFLPLPKKP